MNIHRIHADIATAQFLNSPIGNPNNDEYIYDTAAYHIQQAIEKSIKYFLHDVYEVDDTSKRFRTHNLSDLILQLSLKDSSFIPNHQDLIDMVSEISDWEAGSRYNEDIVSTRTSISKALLIAEKLFSEVMEKEQELSQQYPVDYCDDIDFDDR